MKADAIACDSPLPGREVPRPRTARSASVFSQMQVCVRWTRFLRPVWIPRRGAGGGSLTGRVVGAAGQAQASPGKEDPPPPQGVRGAAGREPGHVTPPFWPQLGGPLLPVCTGLAGLGNTAFLSRPILHRVFVLLFGNEFLIYNWLWFSKVKRL